MADDVESLERAISKEERNKESLSLEILESSIRLTDLRSRLEAAIADEEAKMVELNQELRASTDRLTDLRNQLKVAKNEWFAMVRKGLDEARIVLVSVGTDIKEAELTLRPGVKGEEPWLQVFDSCGNPWTRVTPWNGKVTYLSGVRLALCRSREEAELAATKL